jgi:acyl dehydratase
MSGMEFESLAVGDRIATVDKGVITTAHIMRWSAAVENWHRIHYDQAFATGHDKLPNVLINGSWKQHVLVQLVKDGLGPAGWLWKLKFRYRRMDVAGDALRAEAQVVARQEVEGFGFVTLAITLLNQADQISTAGHAIGVMPLRGGPPVPYPFVPQPAYGVVRFPQDD